MKKLIMAIVKLLTVIFYFYVGIFSYSCYQKHPARAFCKDIPENSTPSDVIKRAKEQNLPVFDMLKNNSKITVLNHKSPFFRVGCEIEFKENHITSKRIIALD